MRWTQRSRAGDIARPFAQDGPWNRAIPANATYATINAAWAALDFGLQTWEGDVYSVTPYIATAGDPLFNVRYRETYGDVNGGGFLRQGNTLANENTLISGSATSFPMDMNGYSTTVVTNPATQTKPPSSAYNVFSNPGTLPYQVRVPASATPSPGADGHMVIVQPDGMIFELYGGIKVTQAQNALVCIRYMTINPRTQGDGWANGLTASMISVLAGVLRNSEINLPYATAVTIPHAMKIAVPGTLLSTATPVYPALAMDRDGLTNVSPYGGTGSLPMGTRLAIPYSTPLTNRGTYSSGLGLGIATAAQRHGFIITDRGGSGLTIFNERGPTQAHLTAWDFGVWEDVNWVVDNLQRVTSAV